MTKNETPESFIDAADIVVEDVPGYVPDVVDADPDLKDVRDLDEDADT
jgi:hypothetical protein